MSWYVARSLQSFIGQCDAAWPNRSKTADGTIGDTRHQQETSGHNPDATGAVVAFDLTHAPMDGPDCNVVSVQLSDSGDKRLSQGYLIWNRRIWFPGKGWQDYQGSDPHTGHLHFSVGHDTYPYKGSHGDEKLYDDPSAWQLPVFGDDVTADELEAAIIKVLTTAKIVPIPGEAHPAHAGDKGTIVQALTQDWGHDLRDETVDRQDLATDKTQK